MGLGIVAMHYTGMAAMRMTADLGYDPLWVAVSVLIAIGASIVALWLAFRNTGLAPEACRSRRHGVCHLGHALLGHAGRYLHGRIRPSISAHGMPSLGQTNLAAAIAGTTFLILFLALVAAHVRPPLRAARRARSRRTARERGAVPGSLPQDSAAPCTRSTRDGIIEHVSEAWLDSRLSPRGGRSAGP